MMKLLRKNSVHIYFYDILSLTGAIIPQNIERKLGALLHTVFLRAMSRSALMVIEDIIFSSAQPNAAKTRLVEFVIIRI